MVSLRARQSLPQQSTPKANKFEPDIDASPVSTDAEGGIDSDDDSLSEFEATPRNRFRPTAGPTLEEKLAQSSKSTGSPSKGKRKWSDEKDFKSPSSSRKRNSKELLSDSADFGGDIFSGIRSSQQSYKRRSLGYGSKFRKTPSSSMGESNPPSSSAPAPKSSTTEVSVKDDSPETEETGKEEDEDEGFKFPKDFDAAMSYSTAEIPDSEEEDSSDLSEWTQNSHGSFDKKSTINDSGDEDEVVQQTEFLCPLCSAPVDSDLLVLFQAQPKQRLREQRAFCESHKKASAEKEYRNKGYPIIDWDKLDKRIEAHINVLEKLLVLDPPSYYRNVLDTTLKQGKAKNFRLTLAGDSLETISCGYYGTRGSNKMLEIIISRFSRKLRRLSAEDHIVKKAGVVGYSQAVLVPELAVKLIKEDMGVDDDSARQIMRESVMIGEKVNFALDDKIPIAAEETDLHDEDGFPN